MQSAGFKTVKLHNQVLSMGEWGWVIGTKSNDIDAQQLKERLQNIAFKDLETKWINTEAMQLMTSFGKEFYKPIDSLEINKIHNPVLYQYYLDGNWDLY